MDPLLREGRMPNLQRCVESGARGTLRTLRGYGSPALWTSVATGKAPRRHGILDFLRDERRAIAYAPADRRAAALWNILGEAGREVLVVGWLATFPVESVRGAMVSKEAEFYRPGSAWPESILARIRSSARAHLPDSPEARAALRRLSPYEPDFAAPADSPRGRLNALSLRLTQVRGGDDFFVSAAEALLAERPYSFFAIHIWGTDTVSHAFGRFSRFDPRPVPEDARAAFGTVLENYYAYADEALGRLARLADPRTVLIVLSDHGSKPNLKADESPDPVSAALAGRQLWAHRGGMDGILAACGPGVRAGAEASRPTILDVAPTVLHLQGLPVAKDMEGRVLLEILEPGGPVRYVKTYPFAAPKAGPPSALAPAEMESLRKMGYLQ